MSSVKENKTQFRQFIKTLKSQRDFYTLKSAGEKILQNLQSLDCFKNAKTILSYWSMDDEVNTHDFNLHFSSKKDIYLPSIQEDKLLIKKFISLQDLVPTGKYQIPEPNGEPIEDIGLIDLIIVPGMAFDRHLNRLGRGKAYYDKLLKNKEKIKVGLCFDFQLFDTIPHDLEDVKMSKIVSASEII